MAEVTVYTFEDGDGDEWGTFSTLNPVKAKTYARENGLKMVANDYEWTDSHVVEDFTGEDEDVADPEDEAEEKEG